GSIAAYYNVDTNNPLNGITPNGVWANGATITAPSITTNVNNMRVIGFFGIVGGTTISPPEANTWTAQSADTSKGATNVTIAAGDEVQTTAGPTGNRIAPVPTSAANTNIGQLMALQPAPT